MFDLVNPIWDRPEPSFRGSVCRARMCVAAWRLYSRKRAGFGVLLPEPVDRFSLFLGPQIDLICSVKIVRQGRLVGILR